MKIELKNVKHAKFASHETECFTADVWVNGKKRGYAENSGQGGCTNIGPHDLWQELENYAKSLPPEVTDMTDPNDPSKPFVYQRGGDDIIDNLLSEHLLAKELQAKLRKRIVMRKGNQFFTVNREATPAAVAAEQARGYIVLNALPFDEALKHWKEAV